jgi:outer membrane protein assembly factor BamB
MTLHSPRKIVTTCLVLLISLVALTSLSMSGYAPLLPFGSATGLRTWNFEGQNRQNTWYSSQNAIGPSNAASLKQVWFAPLPNTAGTPVVSGGLVYVTGAPVIEALNETTGSVIWRDGPPKFNFSTGVTVDSGSLFAATANGYLLSLNALTGALNWNQHASMDPSIPDANDMTA